MEIVSKTYSKLSDRKAEKQYAELTKLIEDTQDIITRLEGKEGQPIIAITTKSKNYTLTIKA